jgi:hypothetical protein
MLEKMCIDEESYTTLILLFEKYCKTSYMKLVRDEKTSAQVKLFCLSTAQDQGKCHIPHGGLR